MYDEVFVHLQTFKGRHTSLGDCFNNFLQIIACCDAIIGSS